MDVLGIDNVFIEVGDLNEGIAFYRDVVGLPVAKRFDDLASVLFQIGTETPGLGIRATETPSTGGQKLWFEVADARASAAELTAAGFAPTQDPMLIPTGWFFEIVDPWGNVVGFTDYLAQPELGRRPAERPLPL